MSRRKTVTVSASRTAPVTSEASALARWWPVAVIVLAGCLAYSNTLHHPFIFDDEQSVPENAQIRDLSDLRAVLSPPRETSVAGRPVVNLTFAVNYAIGGLHVAGYHVWNIATHVLAALLFFGVLRRTLARQAGWLRDEATPLACAAAVLWAVHPLNTDAVDYITQRTELTMGALLLLTLYASLRALDSPRRAAWAVGAVVACALGMASKESMATAPVLVALYDRVFAFTSWRAAWRARKGLYVGLAATWAVLAAILSTHPRSLSAGFSSGVLPAMYLLNQFPIVARYLGLAFWPHALVQNYGWPEPIALVSALPSIALIAALLAATILAFRWSPAIAFLGAWIWITLSPTSSIVPIATEVGAERRMYVPLLALVTLVAIAAAAAMRRVNWRAQVAVLTAAAAALLAATLVRNGDYVTPLTMAQTNVDRRPSPVARHVLATELLVVGAREQALAQLRLAVAGAPRARYTLGVELLEGGQTDQGIAMLQWFIQAQPHLNLAVNAHEYLGKAFAQRGEWAKAEAEFQAMLDLNANHPPAERLNPQNGPVERNLAYLLYQKHDIAGARLHAERAVALEPGDQAAQALLHTLQQIR